MTRAAPVPALAWRIGGRTFLRKHDAYYAIARALVVAKYPAWLHHDIPERHVDDPNWPIELQTRRLDKSIELFCFPDNIYAFDQRRWRTFIRRVARFLAFVDSRRLDPDADTYDLRTLFMDAERSLMWWAERANRLQKRIRELEQR